MAAITRISTGIDSSLPTRSIDPLLEHAEQLDLDGGGQVADLVEKDRPAGGRLETAPLVARRAGERPFDVAEQLALQHALGQGRAVDGHERARRLAG